MKVNRLLCFFSLLVILIAAVKIVFQLNFWVIPSVFFFTGLVSALWNHKYSLYLFVFLFPFINSTPVLFDSGYPYNYLAVPLFLLSGIVIATVIQKIKNTAGNSQIENYLDRDFYPYYLFLLILLISTIFVLLRWSNFTLSSAYAIGANTPVSPPIPRLTSEGIIKWYEQRISFGSIFPVVSLFIYFISPYIFFYIRKINPKENVIFKWLSYGFFISVALGVLQKISGQSIVSDRIGKGLKQFHGGFSDFNSFGFFSGVMFLWSTYEIKKKNTIGYITFLISLAGSILSGSRTTFIFIGAGIFNLLFSVFRSRKRQQRIIAILLIVGVLVLMLFAGGTLKKRLNEGFSENESLFDTLNSITNGRLWMTLFSMETIRDNFISGVGTGNFTFYLAYKNYLPVKNSGEEYLYDLTLNHYLLVFTENGVLGFLFFAFFMVFLFRRTRKKLMIGTILFTALLNNFFWFPEAFLLFWILAALNDTGKKFLVGNPQQGNYLKIATVVSIFIFIVFNIISFNSLHPKTWAKETRTHYDYGFWYPEKDEPGKEFYWTKERAGIYLQLDENGESPQFKLFCGAPLAHLREKKQKVEIFWKGKSYKEVIFTENKEFSFKIKSQSRDEGFLEVKVLPSFNLKKLNLGPESRDLGIQFFKTLIM